MKRFETNPASQRQQLLARVPYDAPVTSTEVMDALGITGRRGRIVAARSLMDLVEDGLVAVVGTRHRPHGRRWNLYQRLRDRTPRVPVSAQERMFRQARTIVERAGFVLVPRERALVAP